MFELEYEINWINLLIALVQRLQLVIKPKKNCKITKNYIKKAICFH